MNPATTQALALWLIQHMDRVRRHEAAGDMVTEVRAAVTRAYVVINRPAPRVYGGPCPVCRTDLLTKPGRPHVTCGGCGTTHDIAERQAHMRDQLDDYLGTAQYASAILPGIGIHVSAGTIRVWASRHRLEVRVTVPAHAAGPEQHLYRLGDIIDLAVARDATRTGLRVLCLRPDLLLRQDSYHLTRGRPGYPGLPHVGAPVKKLLYAILAAFALALALAAAAPALADSPHFLYATNSVGSTGALTTSFKEAGLGTGTTSVTITVTVLTATADYQCFNNGGNHPQAGNKETVVTSLAASGTFPVRHGQTTASLTVGPPSQGDFACPNGQRLYLQSVTYSGISVSDAFGTTIAATPDPVSSGPVHIPV